MKVLIVVDPLKDFCAGGALPVPEGDRVIPIVNQLLRSSEYDVRVAVREAHGPDHGSFYTNHPGAKVLDVVLLDGIEQRLWPEHGVKGTRGAEYHDELEVSRFDREVEKGMNPRVDSYSGFFDNQKRQSTGLLQLLEAEASKRGETLKDVEIHVVGLALDYCVMATALDAAELGLKAAVIVDATRAVNVNPGDEEAALRKLANAGVELLVSRDILREVVRAVGERERGISL